MTIREKILEKVQNLPENVLNDVYDIVEKIEEREKTPSLMERLRKIKIDGPSDFSRNIDLYLSGEKKFDDAG